MDNDTGDVYSETEHDSPFVSTDRGDIWTSIDEGAGESGEYLGHRQPSNGPFFVPGVIESH